MQDKKYYINGKQYTAKETRRLCHFVTFSKSTEWFDDGESYSHDLYITASMKYLLVEDTEHGIEANIIDKAAAMQFLDKHAAYIDTKIYDRLLGKPEEG